ncbi:acyl-CoA reductase [Sphingomonas oligophenolica]|uniref:Acyl-CoA reductase n=1 Tax=Sphingomonas oligophenolica TaxID=301154 RepID=A0ABU9YA09_9SPHN
MNDLASVVAPKVSVPHFVKGRLVVGEDANYGAFLTPALDIDALVWPRSEAGPAFSTPLKEIMDLLVATGERMKADPSGVMADAFEAMADVGDLDRGVLKRAYDSLPHLFTMDWLKFLVEGELGADVLDGWRRVTDPSGRPAQYRAFPPRLVHVLAGNAPGVAAISIIRGALTKGINLLKLPSNDLFTATAILRTMAEVDPDHPVVKSFSAVYWKGGDEAVEKYLLRPIYFDKLVAWGGEGSLRSAKKYVGPGFELVAFDPKTSISMIGREAFESPETLAQVADHAATDSCLYDQSACTSSRFHFIEATMEEAEAYCELLQAAMGQERQTASIAGARMPPALREDIDALRSLDPFYKVWGDSDGRGVVILSEDPVDFHPEAKTVNVVPVERLEDALRYASVATQTVGVYPAARKVEIREKLAAAGAQRIVTLGWALGGGVGIPHDGFFPLHRLVRWITDEC